MAQELAPLRPRLVHSSLLVKVLPINLASTGINVNVSKLDPAFALPEPASNVKHDDDEGCEIRLEESLGLHWSDGGVELRHVSWEAEDLV
jgi:hypothetical protein